MRDQIILIMTGLPYSGKSTLSRELSKRFGFRIASVDEVLEEKNFDIESMTQEDWNYAYSKAYGKIKSYISQGNSVIVDIGNLKRSERETARRIAQELEVKYKLIYINTPEDEIRKRWIQNQKSLERDHLEEKILQRAFDMFEEPMPEENPIIYNQQINLEEWIKQNMT